MRPLPGIAEHPLEVYLLFAVGTRLLLSHNAPATDAEFMEYVIARQPVRVLDDALFTDIHKDLLPTHSTHAVREVFGGHARLAVELAEKSTRKEEERCGNQLM